MKEHHIDICTELIPATLDGRKTQMRRVIEPQPKATSKFARLFMDGAWRFYSSKTGLSAGFKPPYKVGDVVWVRESWLKAIHPQTKIELPFYKESWDIYKKWGSAWEKAKWKSPATMPRWASRITLEITDIRVERLQEISGEDAKTEGLKSFESNLGLNIVNPQKLYKAFPKKDGGYGDPIEAFENLWNSLAKKGFKWEDNPWVWVISFKRVK